MEIEQMWVSFSNTKVTQSMEGLSDRSIFWRMA
jgi:hypothetical protein